MNLIELIISTGIACFVVLLTSNLIVASIHDFAIYQNLTNLSSNVVVATKVIDREFSMSGGSFLSPWLSTRVENNCVARDGLPDCAQTDRVTVATGMYNQTTMSFFPVLPVTSFAANTISVSFSLPSLPCPLNLANVNRHILLINSTYTEVFSLWVTGIDAVACTMSVDPDVQGTVLNTPNFAVTNYAAGSVNFVRLRTYFMDPTTKDFGYLEKNSNVPGIGPNEAHMILQNIFDFQVALGYDRPPQDGVVADNASTVDEILFNAAGDTLATIGGVGVALTDLRQLLVALVVGEKVTVERDFSRKLFKFFDGPVVSANNYVIQGLSRRIYLRNSMTYL